MSKEVLVVDDDPDMVDVVQFVLSDAGYATRTADNGQAALDAVALHMPQLILLDLLMPVMDGWQCARELRARYGRTLPIVVITAAEHVRARSREIDADGVLPKPFEVSDLLTLVAAYTAEPEQDRRA